MALCNYCQKYINQSSAYVVSREEGERKYYHFWCYFHFTRKGKVACKERTGSKAISPRLDPEPLPIGDVQ